MYSFGFAPKGFAMCDGQLLPITQNQALFALLGTFYGGNGTTNFALPNYQGRVPMSQGNGFSIGQSGGTESTTIAR
jgi:microcystin-dependent protein